MNIHQSGQRNWRTGFGYRWSDRPINKVFWCYQTLCITRLHAHLNLSIIITQPSIWRKDAPAYTDIHRHCTVTTTHENGSMTSSLKSQQNSEQNESKLAEIDTEFTERRVCNSLPSLTKRPLYLAILWSRWKRKCIDDVTITSAIHFRQEWVQNGWNRP